jgi:RNA polymerase primary sigma factor
MRSLVITNSITNREDASLDKYLSDVSKESLITVEEETELAQKIRNGDQKALRKLVRANLRFVISVAKQYQGSGIPLVDLISEGNLGLIKAAKKFDETRGFKFISYAVWWIRQGIMSCIAEQSRAVRLPVNQTANIQRMKKAAAAFEQEMERSATNQELSEILEVSLDKIEISSRNQSFHISLDAPLVHDENFSLNDVITDNNTGDADGKLIIESLQIEMKSHLVCLKPIEKNVIINSFGIGKTQSLTLSEIALEHNLTAERIRQIRQRALSKLRARMKRKDYLNKI